MLGIKRLDHVCMAVWKLEERLPMLTELFGLHVAGRFENPRAGYNGVTLDIPGGGVQWELLEPSGEQSFIERFLQERGPGLHHLTFEVESVEKATEALKKYGYEPFGGRSDKSYKEVYLHPRDTGGVLIQLYEGGWSE
ncbi:MAG: VOC family protein [Dehalococcoidia bacterium]|nr:VOC family protein [Dehalococcoidia bacterium]